jgi:hypothetical protein
VSLFPTGSFRAILRARAWLDECINEHGLGCRHTRECRLPTRILRIDGPRTVKLYASKREPAAYLCLSHCWGTRPILQTTTLNLDDHLNAIPWEDMPRSFQDAVTFTHGLGFKYLWIDSLCEFLN